MKEAAAAKQKAADLAAYNKKRALEDADQLKFLEAKLAKAQKQAELNKLAETNQKLADDATASEQAKKDAQIALAEGKQAWADTLADMRKQNALQLQNALDTVAAQEKALQAATDKDSSAQVAALEAQKAALVSELARTKKLQADAKDFSAMNKGVADMLKDSTTTAEALEEANTMIKAVEDGDSDIDITDSDEASDDFSTGQVM